MRTWTIALSTVVLTLSLASASAHAAKKSDPMTAAERAAAAKALHSALDDWAKGPGGDHSQGIGAAAIRAVEASPRARVALDRVSEEARAEMIRRAATDPYGDTGALDQLAKDFRDEIDSLAARLKDPDREVDDAAVLDAFSKRAAAEELQLALKRGLGSEDEALAASVTGMMNALAVHALPVSPPAMAKEPRKVTGRKVSGKKGPSTGGQRVSGKTDEGGVTDAH